VGVGAAVGELGSEPRLVALLRDEILAAPNERITFARFMERVLTEPGLGYYATSSERPTRQGDFLTAPELHPLFGRCVGRLLTGTWQRLGSPARFSVREWGAGRGTLARTVREGLAADGSALATAIDWQPVDLPGRHPDPVESAIAGAVVANEYLDALPVHRVVVRAGSLREAWVTWSREGFEWAEGELSSPALAAPIEAAGVTLAEGQVAEVRPGVAGWIAEVARTLERGVVLVIDYGHEPVELYGPRRRAGSLVTYRGHAAGDDPFQAVGRQDITAHVDLGDLRRAALAHGLTPGLDTTLAAFLAGQGLGELLNDLGRDPATDPQAYLEARASVLRLLDPRHLGGQRVLTFEQDHRP
jgi:SAM-dependent MidA family methyltransferase